MIVATTHDSADFDCTAGLLAVTLLHPGAVAAFPGARASAVKRYLEARPELLPEVRARDVDLNAVETLILVDTVSPERIGRFRKLLEPRRRVRVICYDHHPTAECPEGAEVHQEATGAVSTLLALLLRNRGVRIEPEQATLLALGIYEDTGGLVLAGTTPRDLRAAAWLVEQGADLDRVARTLQRGLSPEQVNLYHELLHEAKILRVNGRDLTLAVASVDEFVREASVVVQQFAETRGGSRLVTLIRMGDRVVLIVRSRARDLDAGRLARRFGGGGHASAASATISDRTLVEVREDLAQALRETVEPAATARDLATPILYKVPARASVRTAVKLLNRYRVNGLPVVEGSRVVGAVTRQLADIALHHGLGESRVRDLVAAELEVVSADADVDTVRRRLTRGSERFLLVGDGPERVEGIITRASLLHHLSAIRSDPLENRASALTDAKEDDLSGMLTRRLSSPALELLRVVGEIAGELGTRAYLVGGIVRDLLLRRTTSDMDVVVEGDAGRVAAELGRRFRARVRAHEAFQTAAVILPDDLRVDLATARTEHYARPGALPEVAPGNLRQDLFRRDFTINTLAIGLTPPAFGRLFDFFSGRKDLWAGKIRVLHGLSFIEDPTRAFRAVRFAVRLGFEISRETARLIRVARREGAFEAISSQRLRREIERILGQRRLARGVRLLASFKLLGVLDERLRPTQAAYSRLERVEEILAWHRLLYREDETRNWLVALGALLERQEPEVRKEVLVRLRPPPSAARVLSGAPASLHRVLSALSSRPDGPPSFIHETCRGEPTETLLLAMALTRRERVRRALASYVGDLRDVRADVRGADLLEAGVPEGPTVAAGLEAALRAKLDGTAPDREAQLRVALEAAGAQGSETGRVDTR